MVLYGGLAVATVSDLATKKIYNWITFSLLTFGLLMSVSPGGIGIVPALTGAGIALGLHWVLWRIGLEGAADAKLMTGVGAFIGTASMLEATLWRYLLHLPFALAVLTVLGRWGNFMAAWQWTRDKMKGLEVGERPEPTYMPFAPLIALAVIAALNTGWLEFFG